MASQDDGRVTVRIGAATRFVVSTSGRAASLLRYRVLLQDLLGLDVAYIPIGPPVAGQPIRAADFAAVLRGMPCLGGAISKDIKHAIVPHLDRLCPVAAQTGSVNTVVVDAAGQLVGYNTDAAGFRAAVAAAVAASPLPVTAAVCYGYGGVCSVVVHVLRSLGIDTYICGRRLDEAARRAAELGARPWTPDVRPQLFVNAAPVTDRPLHDAANFLPALAGCVAVFDHEMPGAELRDHCQRNSVAYVSGTEMYWPQMVAQWSLFLDGLVDPSRLPDLLREADKRAS